MIWQDLVDCCKLLLCKIPIHTAKCCKLLSRGICQFFRRGSIVGTRYLWSPNYHWSERLFWLCMLFLAFNTGVIIIRDYARHYSETAYSIIIEEFPSTQSVLFPSVGICASPDWTVPPNVTEFLSTNASLITVPRGLILSPEFHDLTRALVYQDFYRANTFQHFYFNNTRSTTHAAAAFYNDFNYTDLALRVVNANCADLLLECAFGAQTFDCCSSFKPEVTMVGGCLVLRSIDGHRSKMELNMATYDKQRNLHFKLSKSTKFFILVDDALPEPITPFAKFNVSGIGVRTYIGFTLRPTFNDKEVEELPNESLKCYKRPAESTGVADQESAMRSNPQSTSFASCLNNCVRQLQIDRCACISWHFRLTQAGSDENTTHCNLKGYACLDRYRLFHFGEIDRTLIRHCRCRLNCNTNGVSVQSSSTSQFGASYNEINATLVDFPRIQFSRQLMRRNVDIVVCLGGILSFCVGWNLINVFELFSNMLQALFTAQ